MAHIEYLKELKLDLESICLENFDEAEYLQFEKTQKKVAMCLGHLFGKESDQVARVQNITTGENHHRSTPQQKEDKFWRAIQELAATVGVQPLDLEWQSFLEPA